MIDDTFKAGDSLVEPLTRRELDILYLLAAGQSNREIADQLTIALTTVKWYARQIYGKLGVNNRRQAAERAKKLGLVESSLPKHNITSQPTPLVGRQKELNEISCLITDSDCKLITMTGPGGIGKTRLALAAAEDQIAAHTFQDGIFFIPLAGLIEGERIVSVIATALQIQLEQGESQLINYLRAKQILLVLDNFEHLLESSDLVIRILQAAPQGKILITSRERLGLQREQVYPLQGLPIGDESTMEDAGQLFLQAAQRIRPDFKATLENLAGINHICHLVEGMPLALELAAAWVDLLSPEDIAAEIQRSLDFLEADLRDIPQRHRSMRAVFDTTWQNLSANSQQVLAQVSIFKGGFTREAATVVTQSSMRDLAALVNKSLLSFDSNVNRYHIHELLRQFSLMRLKGTAVQDRHCDYYLKWLVQQSPKLIGAEQEITGALIEMEMDNIRAAINQALRILRIGDFDQVIRVLTVVLETQGRPQENVLILDHIRTQLAASPDASPRILYWATAMQERVLGYIGQPAKAEKLRPTRLALLADLASQNLDIRPEQAFSYFIDGYTLYIKQPDEARRLAQQSHDLALELNDLQLAGQALWVIGLAARNQGDLEASEAAIAEYLSLFQTLNNRESIILAQIMLGELARIGGNYEKAERQLSTAIASARQYQLPSIKYGLSKLQMVYIFSGQFKKARPLLAEDRLLSEESGYTWGIVRNNLCLGLLHLHEEGRYSEAQELGEQTLHMGREHGLDHFACHALVLLAQVDIALGNYEAAKERLEECDSLYPSQPGDLPSHGASEDLYWGFIAAALRDTAAAQQHVRAELETAVRRKDRLNLANALAAIAFLYLTENEAAAALENYELARQHPFVSNSRWFEDVVGRHIAEIVPVLPPKIVEAAKKRSESLDLWETAEKLVVELRDILS